ncbi:MAG: hypothetical protein ACI906_004530 [Candidatus Latescibacterota bacterium]|jgi:hypothetical protein
MAWYKGNLHMHSYWTDGHDFPEMIADWFKGEGYDFIAFTEHDQHQVGEKWASRDPLKGSGRSMKEGGLLQKYVQRFGKSWVETRGGEEGEVRVKPLAEYRHLAEETGRFLIITGEEVTTKWGYVDDWSQTHWINVFNTPVPVEPQHDPDSSPRAMQATLDVARSMGEDVLVFLNHPNFGWNATAEDIAAVAGLRHMEIYTALNMCATFGDELHCPLERLWDVALALRLTQGGDLIYGLATDDCHAYAPHFEFGLTALPGRAWICVRSDELTPKLILGAVNQGDYYCSSGVALGEVELNSEGIALQIKAKTGVRYTTQFIGTPKDVDMSSKAVVDSSGKTVRTTRTYSEELGQVLHETTDLAPSYSFTGNELYIRAVVTSDISHPNPTGPGDVEKAWTQAAVPQGVERA